METLIDFCKQLIISVIYVLDIALFVRALLSWFDPMQEGKLSSFLYMLTEPLILPFRKLCAKMHWFEGVPLDIPFMMTWLALMLVQILLEAL